MAVITSSTFDPLKRRCNVRLQQGVPIVDSDWNELDDIRKFELRAYLKWFVGDGVPDGNDGFRIDAIGGVSDDLMIRMGVAVAAGGTPNTQIGLRNVGRCIVDGLDVVIGADIAYKAQPFFGTAAPDGTPGVGAIPVVAGPVSVYLDVWERLVTSQEDSSLVLPGLGTESCARLKREWCVRTRPGAALPAQGDADFIAGHSYYALATLNRIVNLGVAANIRQVDLTDRRERRLLAMPSTMVSDVLGVNLPDYRRGMGRPVISLRDAINALLRGDLPGSPEAPIAPDPSQDLMSYAMSFDAVGAANVLWHSDRVGGANQFQIFASRWDPANPGAGFSAPLQVTAGPTLHQIPQLVTLPTGDLLVAYESGGPGNQSIVFKRGAQLTDLPGSAETFVAPFAAASSKRHPFAVVSGSLAGGGFVVFFWHQQTPTVRWMFRRRQYPPTWAEASANWVAADGAGQELSPSPAPPNPATEAGGLHAAVDAAGDVWCAFSTPTNTDIQAVRLTPSTGVVAPAPATFTSPSGPASVDLDPFVVVEGNTAVWVFWRSGDGVISQRFLRASSSWEANSTLVAGTNVGLARASPSVALDTAGALWLFWITDGGAGSGNHVFTVRRDPVTQSWTAIRRITGSVNLDLKTFSLLSPGGALWVFFTRNLGGGNTDLFFKQLVTNI